MGGRKDGWTNRRMMGRRERGSIFVGTSLAVSIAPVSALPHSAWAGELLGRWSQCPPAKVHICMPPCPPAPLWAGVKLEARPGSAQSGEGAPAPGALDQSGL